MITELLGRTLRRGDIVSYPASNTSQTLAVITSEVPIQEYLLDNEHGLPRPVITAGFLGTRITGHAPYCRREWIPTERRSIVKGWYARKIGLDRRVTKIEREELLQSNVSDGLKEALIKISDKHYAS